MACGAFFPSSQSYEKPFFTHRNLESRNDRKGHGTDTWYAFPPNISYLTSVDPHPNPHFALPGKTYLVMPDSDCASSSICQPFRQESFNLPITGMAGCTILILVSRKAVYFAHFVEIQCFRRRSPNDDFDRHITPLISGTECHSRHRGER